MSEELENKESVAKPKGEEKPGIARRDIVTALASVPVFGAFFATFFGKKARDDYRKQQILSELGVSVDASPDAPQVVTKRPGETIRLGIIGFGGEGEALVRAAGFAHPDWPQKRERRTRQFVPDTRLEDFLGQDDLNVELTGVCDIFDAKAERGLAASGNDVRPGGGSGCPFAGRGGGYGRAR